MQQDTIIAAILGLLEGLTEFIPVSSTGHLLLAGHFLGFDSPGRAFEVLIQLGAIMAILGVYARRLWGIFASAPHDPVARRFILSVLLAFMPAVVIGVMAHGFIKEVLFETPMLVAAMLVLGGIVLLIVDRLAVNPTYERPEDFPPVMALKIGMIQCFAMIPGVSRSGASIVGGLMLGADKRAAAEFSFFLSMPTMAGAFAYDLYKNRDVLDAAASANIMLGFACAMMAAVVVVRWLLEYVSRNGYAVFAWWRIGFGITAMTLLVAGF